MNQLVRLHKGLFRFIRAELKKKKSRQELIKFYKDIAKAYFGELFRLSKSVFLIFDKEYRKKRKEYKKYIKIKADLKRALKILQYVDTKLAKSGLNRQRRRHFWQEFYKDGRFRKEIFEDLMKDIEKIRG